MEREKFIGYLRNSEKLDHDSLGALQQLTVEYPWFQAGWILYLKNLKNIGSPEFKEVLKKVAILVPDRKQLHRFLNGEIGFSKTPASGTESQTYELEEGGLENKPKDSLIDRFLSNNPGGFLRKPQPQKTSEQADNKHIIDKSVSENDELITETLASIYFKQKNYEKALDAYRKLSLKYPEKSIYFASRIKEIEVIKNNT